jgi:hypothetical protein
MVKPRNNRETTPSAPWIVRPASASAHKQWETAISAAPELMEEESERLTTRPLDRSQNPRRTQKLKGKLATERISGKHLDQWQHELTSAGRIWYCPDKENHIIWVTAVRLSHPKATE